jgi:hypothetical protein
MIVQQFPELIDISYSFKRRGTPLPPDRRPFWRIALIAQLLNSCCRGDKSSLLRLRILDWGSRMPGAIEEMAAFLTGAVRETYAPVRYDPSFLRAVAFGVAIGLFSQKGAHVSLTAEGIEFAKKLRSEEINVSLVPSDFEVLAKKFLERHVKEFLEARN